MIWKLTVICMLASVLALTACGRASGNDGDSDADADTDTDTDAGDADIGPADADEEVDAPDDGGDDADIPHEPECGDFICDDEESCVECPTDCGRCPECDLAPSCTGAPAVPTESERLEAFDNAGESIYVSGVGLGLPSDETDCMPAQLRIRLRQIKVYDNGHTPLINLDMYCIITASDGFSSELFVTPLHTRLHDDHAPLVYEPLTSSFWGLVELHPTESNLTITYQCLRSRDLSDYEDVMESISDAAADAGGVAGPYGWAFGLGSVAASIVGSALGASGGDEVWLSVQQTIDADAMLELTNGRIWQIQQTGEGTTIFEEWDIMLEVEAWGCADVRERVD